MLEGRYLRRQFGRHVLRLQSPFVTAGLALCVFYLSVLLPAERRRAVPLAGTGVGGSPGVREPAPHGHRPPAAIIWGFARY